MQIIVLLTVLSLAPAILLMMTSFTRIIIVLALLRQALGTQQLPPNQILIGLAMFMTFLIMGPTWQRVNDEALQPYMNGKIDPDARRLAVAVKPVRQFMIEQINQSRNEADVDLFMQFAHQPRAKTVAGRRHHDADSRVHAQRTEDRVSPGFRVYLAVPDYRHGDLVRADQHGNDDAAAGADFVAV